MNVHETLSALMDDACEAQDIDRLLAELAADPAAMQQWSRFCAQRDAREGVQLSAGGEAWVSKLMSAVQAEPVPMLAAHPKVASLAARRTPRWRPLAAMAAAASVAAVVVTLMVGPQADPTVPGTAPLTTPVSGIQQVADNRSPPRVDPAGTAQPLDAEDTWLLNNYLLEHNNALASQGVGGTLRYARFAAHTREGVRPVAVSVEDAR